MKTRITLVGIAIIIFASVDIYAQGSGTTAAEFLNIGVNARSSATGGAFSAIADGPTASFYNPAGIASIGNYQVAGMHTEWFQDLRYEYLGLGMPVKSFGGIGLSFSYLSYGSINSYSESGASTGNINAYDMALNLSYGHRLTENLSMGLGVKTISEKLDNIRASGYAGDFGLQYRTYKYTAGISVMNVGPKMKYESASSYLPTTVNAGVAYRPLSTDLTFMLGAAVPMHSEMAIKAGIEYSYNGVFMLRGGYDASMDNYGSDEFSFGAGIAISNHNLDYSYNIDNVMGGTHQISFVFKFGGERHYEKNHETQYSNSTLVEEKVVTVQETYTDNKNDEQKDIGAKYQICAARYQNRTSAEKHVATLKKLDVASHLYYDGYKEYRVVVGETDDLSKAEKIKSKFDKEGVFCYIQEM